MLGNRSRDTAPELAVRSAVHRLGLRYRVADRPLSGQRLTADLVFRASRVAVFVDGCYWHGCPDHYKVPVTNTSYWAPKIKRNIERDGRVTGILEDAGWLVLRFWEHEDPDSCAAVVAEAVRARHA